MLAQTARNTIARLRKAEEAAIKVVHGRAILGDRLAFACSASNVTIRSDESRARACGGAGDPLVRDLAADFDDCGRP